MAEIQDIHGNTTSPSDNSIIEGSNDSDSSIDESRSQSNSTERSNKSKAITPVRQKNDSEEGENKSDLEEDKPESEESPFVTD